MKVLKIVIMSGFSLELYTDPDGDDIYLKITKNDPLFPKSEIITMTYEESLELSDFLEVVQDEIEISGMIAPSNDNEDNLPDLGDMNWLKG